MSALGRLCVRFGRFNLVGLMGAALQLVLLDVLMECFHLPAIAAAPIAVETVILHNFFWHERFTWRDRPTGLRQKAIRLWRFHASNGLISLAGNTLLTYCLSHKLKVPPLASAATAIALCAPINFLVADCWVYREGTRPNGCDLQLNTMLRAALASQCDQEVKVNSAHIVPGEPPENGKQGAEQSKMFYDHQNNQARNDCG